MKRKSDEDSRQDMNSENTNLFQGDKQEAALPGQQSGEVEVGRPHLSTQKPESHGVNAEGTASEEDLNAGAPDELVEPEQPLPRVSLADLPDWLRARAQEIGWNELRDVQAMTIPYVRARRDLMVQAKTGSGKTGAYLLPILEALDPALAACQALVLVPTRELALQVHTEATRLAGGAGIRAVAVYGGVGYGAQLDALRRGAHIVVGTPGRLLDHLKRGSLQLDDVRYLILDEADRMLSMGFYPDMRELRKSLPSERASYMFSATFPANVLRLAREFLRDPGFLSLSRDAVYVASTEHVYYEVPALDKDRILIRLIEIENPSAAIIFCNTKQRVNYVATVLQRFGYDADQLTADLSQSEREGVLRRLREGRLRFLVATDLAGRGIDISHLSHVFQYEVPEDPEAYIHRAGRTGRSGGAGTVISLVSYAELADFNRIMRQYGIPAEKRPLPSEEDVMAIVEQRVTALLEAKLRDRDPLQLERMRRFVGLARRLAEAEEELDVIAMLIDDYYQETLHKVPVPEGGAAPKASAPRQKQGPSAPKSVRRRRRSRGEGRSH
ncbi:MAG: DEAD/DEAH box helicase [Candidatus Sumerlaea chitinivorans]|uniref:RNA helicase n=1 Tax=Sumerlaea chitinivorans TaxID=2250252 RepID=A0A2Z4Y7W3_SUMC1|nr:ATP-dependent RNA helicase [Candidatus Sumerlaea chitinivorans]MCX7963027.1 DEAD/DEAH box helicase [Candidatus Sumerlaea chitinivorans]